MLPVHASQVLTNTPLKEIYAIRYESLTHGNSVTMLFDILVVRTLNMLFNACLELMSNEPNR